MSAPIGPWHRPPPAPRSFEPQPPPSWGSFHVLLILSAPRGTIAAAARLPILRRAKPNPRPDAQQDGSRMGSVCAPPAEAEVRAALARVLASPAFRRAPQVSKLLAYVVESLVRGHGERLKALYDRCGGARTQQ
jgi:hypothetical protein